MPREKLLVNAVQLIEQGGLGIDAGCQELVTALRTAKWDKAQGSYVDHLDSLLVACWLATHKQTEPFILFSKY